MAKTGYRHNRSASLPPFLPLALDVIESVAFRALPPSAAKGFIFFLRKPIKERIFYRDSRFYTWQFEFSYTEAESYGFARATWNRVLRELLAHGFIDLVSKGDLKSRRPSSSKFVLSERWRNFGTSYFDQGGWQRSFPPKYDPDSERRSP